MYDRFGDSCTNFSCTLCQNKSIQLLEFYYIKSPCIVGSDALGGLMIHLIHVALHGHTYPYVLNPCGFRKKYGLLDMIMLSLSFHTWKLEPSVGTHTMPQTPCQFLLYTPNTRGGHCTPCSPAATSIAIKKKTKGMANLKKTKPHTPAR